MKSIRGLLAAVAVLLLLPAGPARAHVVEAGAELRVTQTFRAGEVTLVVSQAPLRVRAQAAEPLNVGLEVRSLADGTTVAGSVTAGGGPTDFPTVHTGPHEIRVRVGDEVSAVPLQVPEVRAAWWTMAGDGAFLALGLLLVGGVLANRMSRPLVGAASAAAAVAVVTTVMAPHIPDAATERGRPYAQGRFSTQPSAPVTGSDFTLTLRLADGATGRPVDDLVVHHEATTHLVVTSEDGAVFRHVHPLRAEPGVQVVRLNVPRPGRYFAHAEIERQGSGGQLLSGSFEVSGPHRQNAVVVDNTAPRLLPAAPVAGEPLTVEVATESPVQPWLGMPGHLVVRTADGAQLAHAHGMAAGQSLLRFTLALPEPGRYLAWVQYAVDGRPVTTSFTVEVAR